MAELLCAADVFVVPSRWEGFGSVLLEAMALEAPIVASDLPAVREVVGDDSAALLVPPDRPDALAAAVTAALADPAGAARRAAAGAGAVPGPVHHRPGRRRHGRLLRPRPGRRPARTGSGHGREAAVTADDGGGRLLGILITFRRPRELALMLQRLADSEQPVDLLVVVDNSPTPDAELLVERYRARDRAAEYVAAAENLGPAGAVALAMRRLLPTAGDDDWIVLFDDGEPPGVEELAEMCQFALSMRARDPRLGAVGGVGATFDWARGRVVRVPDERLDGPVPVDYIGSGQLPLYSVRAARAVGVFKPELFFGFEELEYGLRLRAAGWSLYVDGDRWRAGRILLGRLDVGWGADGRLRPDHLARLLPAAQPHRHPALLRTAGGRGPGQPARRAAEAAGQRAQAAGPGPGPPAPELACLPRRLERDPGPDDRAGPGPARRAGRRRRQERLTGRCTSKGPRKWPRNGSSSVHHSDSPVRLVSWLA